MPGPSPTSFRHIVGSVGLMAVGFGLYSYFRGLDVPWGYQQKFGAVSVMLGVFCLLGARFWPSSANRDVPEKPIQDAHPWVVAGEKILKDGPANRAVKFGNVGGWLYLTDMRLVFVKFGFRTEEPVSIPLEKIIGMEPTLTLFIIPNSLRIRMKDAQERFVLNDRTGWINAITKAKSGK